MDERSREILTLESRLRDLVRVEETLESNNSAISTEYQELERKYTDSQVRCESSASFTVVISCLESQHKFMLKFSHRD